MSLERVDKKLPPDVRNAQFVARHYKHIMVASFGLVGITLIVSFIMHTKDVSTIEAQSKVIDNMANKVIMVSPSGQVIQLTKTPVANSAVLDFIRDIIYNNLILSGFDLYYNNIDSFNKVWKLHSAKVMQQFLDKNGLMGYNAYLQTVWNEYKGNQLPELIYIQSPFNDSLTYKNNKFIYEVNLPVLVRYVEDNQWQTGAGVIKVRFKGRLDMNKSSSLNPLGIMISSFKIENYVTKGSSKPQQ